MRAVNGRRVLVLVFVTLVFLLSGRLPDSLFRLERVSAAAPVANDDSYVAVAGQNLIVNAPGVLANDTDADNDPLTVNIFHVLGGPHGSLYPNLDGSFTYVPAPGFVGIDTFTYEANDGTTDSNTATATIHVDSLPVANNDSYTTIMNIPINIPASGVLANDSDADNDPLTAALATQPAHGTASMNSDGSFTYTPSANYFGTDSFTYRANDGVANSTPATVTISIDAPPVAVADNYATPVNQILNVNLLNHVLMNDTDAEGDPLSAVAVSLTSSGTLTLNSNGTFTYIPNTGYSGTDSFTYLANDGLTNSAPATVTIYVGDRQPAANDNIYDTPRNTLLTIPSLGILADDSDGDGDPLTAVLKSTTAHGTLNLNSNGSFTYQPDLDFTGTDSFTYYANDGKVNSFPATVTLYVDTPPVSADDSYFVGKNTSFTVPAPGVLTNDTDADGHSMTTILQTPPSHGSLTLNNDGSFSYTPTAGFVGLDSFTYAAVSIAVQGNDATVTLKVIEVSAPNAAPPTNFYAAPTIYLTWTRMSGAIGYQVQVSTSKTFANTPAADITVTSGDTLFANVSSLTNGVYYWRIRVQTGANTWGTWKAVDSFTVFR